VEYVAGHIPPNIDVENAFTVEHFEKCDKPGLLTINNAPSTFNPRSETFQISHNAEAFAVNFRAYIETILPLFKCSDGNSIKYVTSYVSKFSDGLDINLLYNNKLPGHVVAIRYLQTFNVSATEMVMHLNNVQVSYTPTTCKNFTLPLYSDVDENTVVCKYRQRNFRLYGDLNF